MDRSPCRDARRSRADTRTLARVDDAAVTRGLTDGSQRVTSDHRRRKGAQQRGIAQAQQVLGSGRRFTSLPQGWHPPCWASRRARTRTHLDARRAPGTCQATGSRRTRSLARSGGKGRHQRGTEEPRVWLAVRASDRHRSVAGPSASRTPGRRDSLVAERFERTRYRPKSPQAGEGTSSRCTDGAS